MASIYDVTSRGFYHVLDLGVRSCKPKKAKTLQERQSMGVIVLGPYV